MRKCYGPASRQGLTIVCLILLAGCRPPQPPPQPTEEVRQVDTLEAETITLSRQPWPTILRSQGSLVADEQSVVGTKVAGRVAEVHIDFGDQVSLGQPLVSLDLEEFQLQLTQSEAQLQQARAAVGLAEDESAAKLDPNNAPPVRQEQAVWDEARNSLQRAERLLRQAAVSQGEYDLALAAERAAEARHAAALNSVREKIAVIGTREAELALARQRLADATIRAPISGYVRSRQVAPGTFVSVGEPIATIVRTDPLRFRGTVPERYAQSLSIGQNVQLQVVSVPEPYVATITRVSPALDPQSRALVFEADIPNPNQKLRAGLFAEAEVVVDPDAEALVIPHTALEQFAGVEKVWKVVDGMATEQEVLAGPRRPQGREILQGLADGDRILLHADQGRPGKVIAATDRPVTDRSATDRPATTAAAAPAEERTTPNVTVTGDGVDDSRRRDDKSSG